VTSKEKPTRKRKKNLC